MNSKEGWRVHLLTLEDVIVGAGIKVKRNGNRLALCCPFHREEKPSMVVYPDGKYYCFGCGAWGDVVDMYAHLHNVTKGEALRACNGDEPPKKPKKTDAEELYDVLQRFRSDTWSKACQKLHEAEETIQTMDTRLSVEQRMQSDGYYQALSDKSAAEEILDFLETASIRELHQLWKEAHK